jgi:hypothetical protein
MRDFSPRFSQSLSSPLTLRCNLTPNQHTPSGRQGPRKVAPGPAGSKGSIGMQWGENGPAPLGPKPRQNRTRAVRNTRQRSARVLAGLYSAFANPALERLGYRMANVRLISRDAAERNASRPTPIGATCFAAALMAAPVSCSAGRARSLQWPPMACAGRCSNEW